MDRVSEIALASIQRDLAQVNRISANTQNVTSTGFKALLASEADGTDKAVNPSAFIDTSQGELKQTDRLLDLAIQGQGWFLLKKEGQLLLTRRGQFSLDSNGYLGDNKGFRLQGTGGDIQLDHNRIQVGRDGLIRQDGQELTALSLVTVDKVKPSQYQQGEILLEKKNKLVLNDSSAVLQGYLEQSNVEPSAEVVAMMAASRHIQTMQKSLSAYDQVLKKAISELGK